MYFDVLEVLTVMGTINHKSAQNPGILPEFLIGVTGHRDIAAESVGLVRDALRAQLSKISEATSNAPLRLVSGLAEGADTLATEVALELGIAVTAVLPMPRDDYQKDFSGAALETLDTLLADPRVQVAEIPLIAPTEGAGADQINRDNQYSLLADYLVRRSNILLAIWDGEQTRLTGGTSDVVLRYLADGGQNTPNFISLENNDAEGCGNVVSWVPARRSSSQDSPAQTEHRYLISNQNYDCYWTSQDIPKAVQTRWKGFGDFCQEKSSDIGASLPAYGLGQTTDVAASPELATLDEQFIRIDQIARSYQSLSHVMFALFGLLAAAMGLAFLIYAKLLADKFLLFIYVGLFIAGFLGFRYSHRLHLHSKHLAYRVLAETLRVQYFLILSGAGADYSLRRLLNLTSVDQFRRFEWLQEAFRVAEPISYLGHSKPEDALEQVNKGWVKDQLHYFEKKRHLLHRQHHRLEVIKIALLVGSVLGALTLIFFKKSLIHLDMMGYDGKAWLVFFMGLLPLWVAVWELYQGKMATRELLWQYANQTRYFRAASQEIQQAPDLASGQKIVRDLADKALIEIFIWSVHRFHREHEPPAAG